MAASACAAAADLMVPHISTIPGTANNTKPVRLFVRELDGTPVGAYLEHFTTGSTFQNMRIGANVGTGVLCEWADPAWGSVPACDGNFIQDSTIASWAMNPASTASRTPPASTTPSA